MSGHSKWSTIKRKKGAADAARGKVFTKIAREITVAAREGGGDPEGNPRLRAALAAAKSANMPKDNQERAIKKGTGELEGAALEEVRYEGRGPNGVGFIIEAMTDNRNRTVAEVRSVFTKGGGELGSDGSASWMFDHKAQFCVPKEKIAELALLEVALEAGGENVEDGDEEWVVTAEISTFGELSSALEPYEPSSGEITWIVKPENVIALEGDAAVSIAKFWAKLDEQVDVQTVYCTASLPDDVMEEYGP